MSETILEVKNLRTSFFTHLGEVQAVRGLSFSLEKGDILGIVGESGSGKSVSALSIMKLIDSPGRIKDGHILFNGKDLAGFSNREMSDVRGNDIAMIFQDPMTSLNPVLSIKSQMCEVIRRHQKVDQKQALDIAVRMLKMVGIPEPEKRIHAYPHQFSGGMRQRAMIATALSCNPKLLIADEPTTALDVTIQAQIIDIMKGISRDLDTSIILITHDLGVIAELCSKIIVMYGGMAMEKGSVEDIFYSSSHPYTKGLLKSLPRVDEKEHGRLSPIKGSPPDLMKPPSGCPFAPRCPHVMQICREEAPALYDLDDTHQSACWLMDSRAPAVDGYGRRGASHVRG